MSSSPLSLVAICAGYGKITVLHEVSFTVDVGEAVGIMGPNGAGKTTLLNAAAGSLPKVTGRVVVEGVDLAAKPAHERVRAGLVLVPEGRQIIGDLSVQANLDITILSRRRVKRDAIHRERVDFVYDLFPRLKDRMESKGKWLSGGEQQMLAIGRALMCSPKVLLLDEPSLGLAAAVVDQVVEALNKVRRELAVVIVEQSPVMLRGVADRTLELRMGRLVPERSEAYGFDVADHGKGEG